MNEMILFQLLISCNNGQPHHQDNMQTDAVKDVNFFVPNLFGSTSSLNSLDRKTKGVGLVIVMTEHSSMLRLINK